MTSDVKPLSMEEIAGIVRAANDGMHLGYRSVLRLLATLSAAEQRTADLEIIIDNLDDKASARDKRIAELEEALRSVMLGGNHLALIISGSHPPYSASTDEAHEHYRAHGTREQFDAWICWQRIMLARDVLSPPPTDAELHPFRWAPGSYYAICHQCKTQFVGDKRAMTCRPCAVGLHADATRRALSTIEEI